MNQKNLYIHIGSAKTGSTALQSSLVINEEYLKTHSIYYGEYNTEYESKVFFSLQYELLKKYLGKDYEKKIYSEKHEWIVNRCPEDFDILVEKIKTEVKRHNYVNTIISNEAFFGIFGLLGEYSVRSGLYSLNLLKRIKKAFSDFNIKIVCYLRRQDLFIESLYNQSIKDTNIQLTVDNKDSDNKIYHYVFNEGGQPTDFMLFCRNMINISDYYSVLCIFSSIFGKDNIIIRPYEKSQLPKGTVYDFYHNILGLSDEQIGLMKPCRDRNERISRDLIEYKLKTKNNYINMTRDYVVVNQVLFSENDNQFYFTNDERARLIQYCKDINVKIAKEFLHRDNGILYYDKMEKMIPYQGLTLEKALLISQKLIARRLTKDEKKKILFPVFNYAEEMHRSIAIYGVHNELAKIVFEIAAIFNKTINIKVIEPEAESQYIKMNDIWYPIYKENCLESIAPDYVFITDVYNCVEVSENIAKSTMGNIVIFPVYDYSDDIWTTFKQR